MAKIADGVLKEWHDGDTVTAADYSQEREMIRVGLNDTDTRVDNANINIALISEEQDNIKTDIANVKGEGYVATTTLKSLQTKVDTMDVLKIDRSLVYTKSEVDTKNNAQDSAIALKADASNVYTKTESDARFALSVSAQGSSGTLTIAAGATQNYNITFPVGRFSSTPVLTYSPFASDINPLYTCVHGITALSPNGATITIINKGTGTAFIIFQWRATI
jgi:hypothetical protein